MIPRLQRFYGGDPMAWLTRVPIALVRACLTMLPRLQAEEALTTIGTGSLVMSDPRALHEQWLREAQGPRAPRRRARATPDALIDVGVGYHVQQRRPVDG